MVLKITDSVEDFGVRVYKLSMTNFKQKEYHPFIATQEWDHVEIDLVEETPSGYIKQLIQNMKVIPKFDKKNVSLKCVGLLCELFPDDGIKLRALYMKDRDKFYIVLNEMGEKHNWW